MMDPTTSCPVVLVPEACEDLVIVAHCYGFHWNLWDGCADREQLLLVEMMKHDVAGKGCRMVEGLNVRVCWVDDSC